MKKAFGLAILINLLLVSLCMAWNPPGGWDSWKQALATYGISATDTTKTTMTKGLLMPSGSYVNFGATYGDDGYGIKDEGGTLKYKSSGGEWAEIGSGSGGHTQNTDTGTTSTTFQIDSGNAGPKLKNNSLVLEFRNAADTAYADVKALSFTVPKTSGVAGSIGVYEANSTDTDQIGWQGPASIAETWWYTFSSTQPSAGQVMLFAAPAGTGGPGSTKTSAQTWGTPVLTSATERLASFAWDGGGSAITVGATSKRCTIIPHAATITGWAILIDQDGAISTHVYKDAWSTSALATTDITASEPPAITATGGTDIGATGTGVGWTTAVAAKDIICAEVHSVTAATWANLVIYGTR